MGAKARPNAFGRENRLRKRTEFTSFHDDNSRRFVLRHFILLLRKRENPVGRVGITVGRNYGGATQRNTLKRHVREFFRKNKEHFSGLDVHFIAKVLRKKVPLEKYEAQLREDFETAKRKASEMVG